MQNMPGSRVPIGALMDVDTFLRAAQHLKGLLLYRNERMQHKANIDNAMRRMIEAHKQVCAELAAKSPRVAELWKLTQAELRDLDSAAPPSGNMLNGGR